MTQTFLKNLPRLCLYVYVLDDDALKCGYTTSRYVEAEGGGGGDATAGGGGGGRY